MISTDRSNLKNTCFFFWMGESVRCSVFNKEMFRIVVETPTWQPQTRENYLGMEKHETAQALGEKMPGK